MYFFLLLFFFKCSKFLALWEKKLLKILIHSSYLMRCLNVIYHTQSVRLFRAHCLMFAMG